MEFNIATSFKKMLSSQKLKKVKVWCEIRGTAGYRGDVNVNGDIVEGGCIREVFTVQ